MESAILCGILQVNVVQRPQKSHLNKYFLFLAKHYSFLRPNKADRLESTEQASVSRRPLLLLLLAAVDYLMFEVYDRGPLLLWPDCSLHVFQETLSAAGKVNEHLGL